MRRLVLVAVLLGSLGATSVPPAPGATRPGAPALKTYLAKMTALHRTYARIDARGKRAGAEAPEAVRAALRGDRAEVDRIVAELRALATETSKLAKRANMIRPPARTKHARYVAGMRLVAQAYAASADGLDRLDVASAPRVQGLSARARTSIRAWRTSLLAAAKRARVTVPAWVKRAGS